MDGAAQGPEMGLISDSVSAATAKIRFMRVAFGLAGDGQKIGRAEVARILDDLSEGGRVTYDWTLTGDFARTQIQEVFLALLCLESAMPLGGTITVTRPEEDPRGWEISGPARADRPDAALWQSLARGEVAGPVMPAHVQFALLPELVRDRHGTITVTVTDDSVTLRF